MLHYLAFSIGFMSLISNFAFSYIFDLILFIARLITAFGIILYFPAIFRSKSASDEKDESKIRQEMAESVAA